MKSYTICANGGVRIFTGGSLLRCDPNNGATLQENLLNSVVFVAGLITDHKNDVESVMCALEALDGLAKRLTGTTFDFSTDTPLHHTTTASGRVK